MRPALPLLLLALIGCSEAPAPTPSAAAAAPPVPVEVEVLAPAPLERAIEATGVVSSTDSAVLRPEVQGLVEAVLFEDGATVRKGQVLVRLRAAEARAALMDAEARERLAGLEVERKRALVERGDAAKADLDRAEADLALAKAAVIRAEEAMRKTTVAAPFDGVTGLREVTVGELIDPTRRVTRIEALDRLVVDLALAEGALASVSPGQPARISLDALPGRAFDGRVVYVAPRVSESSRTLDVRVAFDAPDPQIRPGLTARARVVTAKVADALLVPTESVVRAGGGMAVYVVSAEDAAELRPIQAGERTERRLEVKEGLSAGERVVVEGLARLRPGARVQVAAPAAPEAR